VVTAVAQPVLPFSRKRINQCLLSFNHDKDKLSMSSQLKKEVCNNFTGKY
jgi:hypothetical protein